MLSRVAENLYWVARYIERAEDTARLISVNSNLLLDMPRGAALSWAALVDITGAESLFDALFDTRSERHVMKFLCLSREYDSSILSSLAQARENLRTTRDVVPREVWEEVNRCYLEVAELGDDVLSTRRRDAFLDSVIRSCQTLNGLIEGTLSHGLARTFLSLGRHVERADMTTRIIDVRSRNLLPRSPGELVPFEHLQWMSVLKSLSAYQMYRQEVRLRVRGPDVLRFLLQSHSLPRSVLRSLEEVSWELEALPRHHRPLAAATLARAEVAEADVQALSRAPAELHERIDAFQVHFQRLHEAIASAYFVVDTRPVVSERGPATAALDDEED